MSSTWMKGAAWLMIAGVIGKILSAGYRVPLQNLGGDVGFYVYQQIYPIIGIGIIFALQGVPAALSRVIAEGGALSVRSFYAPVFLGLASVFFSITGIGYVSADALASLMGDPNLGPSLKASFLVFILVPFVALGRGVFQGKEEMSTSAISQLIEQFVRVGGILLASWTAYTAGDVYIIGTGTSVAVLTGMALSFLYLAWKWRKSRFRTFEKSDVPRFFYVRRVLFYSFLIGVTYMLLLFLQLVDAFTFVPLLMDNGVSQLEAREWKGIYDRAQPLIQLVLVLATSVGVALLPAVVRSEKAGPAVSGAMTVTLVISAAACTGLIVLFPEINRLFFLDEAGTGVLRVQMLLILPACLAVTSASALQGLGHMKRTAGVISCGLVLKWMLNVWLIPVFHIYGAALASIVTMLVIVGVNLYRLKRKLHIRLFSGKRGRVGLALAGMALAVAGAEWLYQPESRGTLLLWVLFLSGGGALLYGVLLREFRALPGEMVPGSWRKWLTKEES